MVESKEISDEDIVSLLNPVSKAIHKAEQKLMEVGFDEEVEGFTNRKKAQKKAQAKKVKST